MHRGGSGDQGDIMYVVFLGLPSPISGFRSNWVKDVVRIHILDFAYVKRTNRFEKNSRLKFWVTVPRGSTLKFISVSQESVSFIFWHEKDWRVWLRSFLIKSHRDISRQSRWQYYQVMSELIDPIAYTRVHPVSHKMYWLCATGKFINKWLPIEFNVEGCQSYPERTNWQMFPQKNNFWKY